MDHAVHEVELPRGRQACEAWRALSTQARAAAIAAASRGVAPPDVGVAWAAAGYGRTIARRLRIARLCAPAAVAAVEVPVTAVLIVSRASMHIVDVVMAALVIAAVGGLLGLNAWARRYQRLHSSGLLGLEAARLGSITPIAHQSVWGGAAVESGFTVPYHAQVPVARPLARPVPDPAGAGAREVPLRRGRALASLAFLLAVALVFWLVTVAAWDSAGQPLLSVLFAVLAVAYTLVLLLNLYLVGPALRRPVVARFTPEGWQIPPQRMSGTWAQVRAIRVRPLAVRGRRASSPRLSEVRVVTLIVDDPQRHIAHLSGLRRRLARGTIRRYGSPVVIVAAPRRSMPVVDLVWLLQHYTPAPVQWDAVGGPAATATRGSAAPM